MALVIKLQHVGAWTPSTDLINLDKEGRSELAIERSGTLSVDQSELDSNSIVVAERAGERASDEMVLSVDQSELDSNIIVVSGRASER